MIRTFLVFLSLSLCNALAVDYHVDASDGDDSNRGTAPDQAWRGLEKVNGFRFQAGDRILFKSGEVWTGQLKPQGSGKLQNGEPVFITIGKYGEGEKPRIDGEGKHRDTLLLEDVEFWRVEDLQITNQGERREPWRTGVRISAREIGKMRHIHLRRLHVHNVNGDLRKEHEGCGIYFESQGRRSHFDHLLIEECHVVRTDRNGICQRGGRVRSENVVIRRNLLEDIGGDGIKLWGTNGGLIEHNIVRGARARCEDHAAGIWPFSCDDTVIQFNEVSGTKGTKDGQGFDADYDCRRTLIQYNYSHNNDGGFILICGPGHSRNEGTIIRYNISVRDGVNAARVFHFGGKSNDTLVHNNTVVIGPDRDVPMILQTDWDNGYSEDARFINNLFIVESGSRASYDFTHGKRNVFQNNLFVGRHDGLPKDVMTVADMPPLVGPLEPRDGRGNLAGFRPRADSDFPRGEIVENHGGRDFFGVPVAADQPPTIGAAEIPPR